MLPVPPVHQLKGLELAARAKIVFDGKAWAVPSQSGKGTYRVTLTPEGDACECEDFTRTAKPCKHIHAARIVREGDGGQSTPPMDTDVIPVRPTYSQNWPLYGKAQMTEKRRFLAVLSDLCRDVPHPPGK